jgi:hypothetical protein
MVGPDSAIGNHPVKRAIVLTTLLLGAALMLPRVPLRLHLLFPLLLLPPRFRVLAIAVAVLAVVVLVRVLSRLRTDSRSCSDQPGAPRGNY